MRGEGAVRAAAASRAAGYAVSGETTAPTAG